MVKSDKFNFQNVVETNANILLLVSLIIVPRALVSKILVKIICLC